MAEHNCVARPETGRDLCRASWRHCPQFSLTTADGIEFSLPDRGNVILINFFATWCGPCQIELPHVEQIWTKNKNNSRFRLLVIGREETMEAVRDFRSKNGFSFRSLLTLIASCIRSSPRNRFPAHSSCRPRDKSFTQRRASREEDLAELNGVLEKQLATLRP